MLKSILRSMLPYGLFQLVRDIRFRHSFDTPEKIHKAVHTIKQDHGFVGLHMGCGPIRHEGYLNCDIKDGEYCIDSVEPFPVPDNSIDYVYSEHFVEHLTFDEALCFMKESFRVLKKGGIFRCLMPDFSLLLSIAVNQPELAKKLRMRIAEGRKSKEGQRIESGVSSEQALLWDSRDDIINAFMRGWGHKYLWSANHLAKAIEYVGFSNVEIMSYGKSSDQRISLDPPDRWGKEWTSVVEGQKL